MKLTTQPVDAVIGMLINDFDKSVFAGGLTEATPKNGMRGNILKADNFRRYKPDSHRTTAYYVVGVPSEGVIRNRGPYSHFIARHPIVVEIHSLRSDDEVEEWKDEAWSIIQTRRLSISSLYSDYRKIVIESVPQDVSAGTKYKWAIYFDLEQMIATYP